jgi:hypothetical protein
MGKTKFHTHTKKKKVTIMALHILIFMSFGQSMGKEEILDRIIAGIP